MNFAQTCQPILSLPKRLILLFSGVVILISISGCATNNAPAPDVVANIFERDQAIQEAPFGGDVSSEIVNYTRVAPSIGIAGKLHGDGIVEAKELGFQLVIDLRNPSEDGVTVERTRASELSVPYVNIPLEKGPGAWSQVEAIEALLESSDNYPVLIHCASANRAGAVWALLRTRQGVSPITAIEEGRAAGMTSRESQVRSMLGLSPEGRVVK